MKVATVWVALMIEAVVLLAMAGAAVKWVRRSPESPLGQVVEPVKPLVEQSA